MNLTQIGLDRAAGAMLSPDGIIVLVGAFEYRLRGLTIGAGRRLEARSGQDLSDDYKAHLVRLGVAEEQLPGQYLDGEYVGYRLLAMYRRSIYSAMKENPLLLRLRLGIGPTEERRVVEQETLLRRRTAEMLREATISPYPREYADIVQSLYRATYLHAEALENAVQPTSKPTSAVLAIESYLADALSQGPAHFAGALFALFAGENVRTASSSVEPCLYDLFNDTSHRIIRVLKDGTFSPFVDDPRGPVEMIGALGQIHAAKLPLLEGIVQRGVELVDAFYRECED